jgi:WD40 repeat protein
MIRVTTNVTLRGAAILFCLCFTPDSAMAQDRAAVVAPAKTIVEPGVRGELAAYAIAFADDNRTFALALSAQDYAAIDGRKVQRPVVLYDSETGERKHVFGPHPNIVTRIGFVNKGQSLLTACTPGDSLIREWDVVQGQEKGSVILPGGGSIKAISKDGKLAVTVRGYPQPVAKVWEIASRKQIAALDGGAEMFDVSCAAVAPDNKSIAIGGGTFDSGVVQLWNAESLPEKRQHAAAAKPEFISFSPKGDLVVSCSRAFNRLPPWGDLELWQYPSGKQLPFQLDYHREYCQFTPDGRHLAVACLSRIELWNIRTGKLAAKFTGPEPRYVQLFAFSPDGTTLAGVSDRGQIVLWKVPKLED